MNRYVLTLGLLCAFSGFALGQGNSPGTTDSQSGARTDSSISAQGSGHSQDTMSGQPSENSTAVQDQDEKRSNDRAGENNAKHKKHNKKHKKVEAGEQSSATPHDENEAREHQGAVAGQTSGSVGAQSSSTATENPQEEQRETPEQERREHQGATTGQTGTPQQNTGAAAGTATGSSAAGSTSASSNAQLQQQVQSALQSQLPSTNVNVAISNSNQVLLTGVVQSYTEKARAEQIAKQAVGGNSSSSTRSRPTT